ncbi:type IX secretion system protein PorD [Pedobacter nutrimenti]|jgi:hypothetical protein|uniref:Uncharacterized protein DUF4835 n=1 Tax=Pedobacter nutrimenti TaxID=1241337 RepID=A0A318UAM4_9SPHI|nr:DUF4835 family protein [Pedobacter nutrimenti]PYF72631.1 uncharacterized protein DUF4835 [Pedobacter nutrimenti]
MKKLLIIALLSTAFFKAGAQELNAKVQMLAPTVPNINKRNLELLQTTIRDFLNNNKWTNETYLQPERIDCNFVITITNWDGGSSYKAEAQIQSRRAVFGSSYNSTLLNMSDKDFDFNYNEGQPVDFSDQTFLSNIGSLLSYYAFTIIGLDKDSFSKMGGTPFYIKAQNILNLAQNAGNTGWKAFDGLRNRYWLNENLLNKSFEPLRTFIYNYHRNGLDILQDDQTKAIKNILAFLPDLQQMDKQKLGSIFPNVYFASKGEEISNVFSLANTSDKMTAYNLLVEIDPANINKYEQLKKSL